MITKMKQDGALTPIKADAISLHAGEDAWTLMASENFGSSWDALYEACPWATVFQSRNFVTTWYRTYRERYLPVVIKAEQGGQLTGLLTLAAPLSAHRKGRIVGAGQYEAEYQAWLTAGPDDGSFIRTALRQTLLRFPYLDIHLRYIPPPAPLHWVNEPYWTSRCVLEPYSRPLMDMSDPAISRMTKKTEFRNKYNRLKRLGTVVCERITDKDRFSAILDDLIVQYDFRQGALFNKNQFLEEPLKADLLLALFDQKLLYVSLLKVQDQIYSAIIAIDGGKWVHLGGINIHLPFNAKFYSPGFVHFILLGQELAKGGTALFDLTPGGDFYKERMATRHDQVHELVVTNSFIYRVKRQLRKRYHKALLQAGKWPMGVELSVRKRIYFIRAAIRRVKKAGMLRTVVQGMNHILHPSKHKLYLAPATIPANTTEEMVARNSLRDLLLFESAASGPVRWAFLEEAMHRFEVGQCSYTRVQEGRLAGCVWLHLPKDSRGQTPAFPPLPEGALLLEGLYGHPGHYSQLPDLLSAATAAVSREYPRSPIYLQVPAGDTGLIRMLEALNFKENH